MPTPKKRTTNTTAAEPAAAEETNTDGPKNGEEYLAAIGRGHSSPATMGDVVSVLQYFGAIPQPDEHAATPFSRTE